MFFSSIKYALYRLGLGVRTYHMVVRHSNFINHRLMKQFMLGFLSIFIVDRLNFVSNCWTCQLDLLISSVSFMNASRYCFAQGQALCFANFSNLLFNHSLCVIPLYCLSFKCWSNCPISYNCSCLFILVSAPSSLLLK